MSENPDPSSQVPEVVIEPGETYDSVMEQYNSLGSEYAGIQKIIEVRLEPFGNVMEKIEEAIDESSSDPIGVQVKNGLREHVPPQVYEEITPFIDRSIELYNAGEALAKKREVLVRKELTEQQTALLEKTDWDKTIARATEDYQFHNLGQLLESFQRARENPESALWTVRRWHDYLEKENLFLPENERPDLSKELWHANGNLRGAIEEWNALTEEALPYLSRARQRELRLEFDTTSHKLQTMARFAGDLGLDGRSETHAPGIIADAIERQVAVTIEKFDWNDVKVRDQNLAAMPNMLLIENQRLLTDSVGVEDVPKWIRGTMEKFPDWYTEGLGAVEFTEEYHNAFQAKGEKGAKTVGARIPEDNKIHLDPYSLEETWMDQATPEEKKMLLEGEIRQTFIHELTHHAHTHTMSIGQLRQWVAVTKMEQHALTDYVAGKQAHAQENGRHFTAGREDLCDSAAYYQARPGQLLEAAPLRFAYWNEIFQVYDDHLVEAARRSIQEQEQSNGPEGRMWAGYRQSEILLRARYEALRRKKLEAHLQKMRGEV